MTLKYQNLEQFIHSLRTKGYENEIPESHLDREIGKTFGLSSYVMASIKKALVNYGFITQSFENGILTWKIKGNQKVDFKEETEGFIYGREISE